MKVTRETNTNGKESISIELSVGDAELLQTVALQFAENIANCKQHHARMRRLAMLIDKKLT